jgi:hypothetical protein
MRSALNKYDKANLIERRAAVCAEKNKSTVSVLRKASLTILYKVLGEKLEALILLSKARGS